MARMRQDRTPSATSADARLCTEMQPSPPASMAEMTATTSRCSSSAWCAESTVSSCPLALILLSVSSRCSRSSSEMPSAAAMLCAVRRPSPLSMARTMATTSRCSSSAACASSSVIAHVPLAAVALCSASRMCWRASSDTCTAMLAISPSVRRPSALESSIETMRRTSRCSSSASCASSAVRDAPCASRFSSISQRCSRSSSGKWFAASWIFSAVSIPSPVRSRSETALRQ
mmetsp:Transcript_16996/g.45843  ORF Transcript_16996/g.45843 Transcript_16996/m.45843 type:complete len:231 (-) Transcript_16996:336-1028(-)